MIRRSILVFILKFGTSEVKLLSFVEMNPKNLFDFLCLHESVLKDILWFLQFTPKYVREPNGLSMSDMVKYRAVSF